MRCDPRPLAALVPLALLATVACSDDGGGPGDDDGLGSIAAGLAVLPEPGEPDETIVWGDLARAGEIAGVARPDDPGDDEAVRAYLQAVTGGPVAEDESSSVVLVPPTPAHLGRVSDQAGFAEAAGWSVLEVDRFIERQTPPGVVTLMEGSFSEDALTDALGEPDDGTWTAGNGESFAVDVTDTSPARPLGESLWLGLDGDHLAVTRSAEHAAAARRTLTGGGDTPTFASDETLTLLASTLDDESPYAAMLVRPGLTALPSPQDLPEAAETLCERTLPEPTAAAATAVADDEGPVILVALAHESADAASTNAEALERLATEGDSFTGQPWSELLDLEDVSTTGDDLVVARLRPTEPARASLWYELVVRQDSLVSSC